MNIGEEIIQIQNRIPYNLPGAMIGYVSSPVDAVIRGIFGFEFMLIL
jgi:hypothetical protein